MPKKSFPIIFVLVSLLITSFFAKGVFAGTTPPSTTYTRTPSNPDGDNGWYVSPVRFDLEATDLESGVKEINYRVDEGTWQKVEFEDTLNLAPNPSFETVGSTTTGIESWEADDLDTFGVYTQDTIEYAPAFATASAKITATDGSWHAINNADTFAVATPYENMTASVWLKTENIAELAYLKVYAISEPPGGPQTTVEVAQSTRTITGTTDWTKITVNFVVTDDNAIGVYLDVGFTGSGTLWIDAASISSAILPATTNVTVGTDGEDHTLEYYSVDFAGNEEIHSCTNPVNNCLSFKIDQTPPGNWHDSGAFRGFFGAAYQLWVYTNVEDPTAGLATFSDKYQYKTELNDSFGSFSNILNCSSTWQEDDWVWPLLTIWPFPGVNSAYLLTPKTSFCNNDWEKCKVVRFFAQDMAGNEGTKDFCINGPWIKLRGEAIVRANNNIDMLSEADGDNTDGLIEAAGTQVDYFSSSRDWEVTESPMPTEYSYDTFWDITQNKTEITNATLETADGVYYIDGDFEIDETSKPTEFDTAEFDQVIFINGRLRITTDIQISNTSTALFIVKGNVEIAKDVESLGSAIFADGDFYTAYDAEEGEATQTLLLNGLYSANKFNFQRTLQGTNNNDNPSEDFIYEPKYVLQLKDFFGSSIVTWLETK